ncbi:MAG: non-hydrolyzing UDP-N-acetylglucosamine 2-epimerase [Candidatus Thorarchaeota archaeon]
MKIVSIVGARPQFIKAAPVSKQIRKKHQEILLHTGQHYDKELSKIFFDDLKIPKPDYNLGIGSDSHAKQIGKMLIEIEKVLLKEKPDFVLVYGDTNSTLAGAISAAKLQIHVAHVEAGLRSFDRRMPEELNRVMTDHISNILFCPTETAIKNLKKEGIVKGVFNIGDVMVDVLLNNLRLAARSKILTKLGLKKDQYLVATIHRPSNTDNKDNLKNIVEAFIGSEKKIIFPVHFRTQKYLRKFKLLIKLNRSKNVKAIDPIGYYDFLWLMNNSKKILTDSGGIQKEAYILAKPCITLRENTEWVETIEEGWNVLVYTNKKKILKAILDFNPIKPPKKLYGDGKASVEIVKILEKGKI